MKSENINFPFPPNILSVAWKVTGHAVTYIESLVCHPNILSVSFRGFSPSRGPRCTEIFVSFLSLIVPIGNRDYWSIPVRRQVYSNHSSIPHLWYPASPANGFVGKEVFTFKKILFGRRVKLERDKVIEDRVSSKI